MIERLKHEIAIQRRWNYIPGFLRVSKGQFWGRLGEKIDRFHHVNSNLSQALDRAGNVLGLIYTYGIDYGAQPFPKPIEDYYLPQKNLK